MSLGNLSLLVTLAALWGASFLFIRVSASAFTPIPLMGVRVVLATAFLAIVYFLLSKQPVRRQDIKHIAIVGIVNQAIPFCLFAFAELTLTAGETSILNSTTPMWTGIIAFFWFGTTLGYSKSIGIALGFLGVTLLMWEKVSFSLSFSDVVMAAIAVLTATLLYGVSANYIKAKLADTPPLTIAFGSMLSASLFLAPFSVWLWPVTPISLPEWLSAALLGIASTGVAHIIYFHLIKTVGPFSTVTVTFLIPVFGMFFGWLILSEEITLFQALACMVIIFGTMLATGFVNLNSMFLKKSR